MTLVVDYLEQILSLKDEWHPVCLVLTPNDFIGNVVEVTRLKHTIRDCELADKVICVFDDTDFLRVLKQRNNTTRNYKLIIRPPHLVYLSGRGR